MSRRQQRAAGPRPIRALRTDRLVGEPLGPSHAGELRALLHDPRVAATLSPSGLPPVPGGSPEALRAKAEHWHRHGFGLWLLRDRASGAMVGRGGLQRTRIDGADEVEIAWAIVPDRWREGLATELARACVELAFAELELDGLVAFTLSTNIASRRVMDKAGMRYERDLTYAGLPHVLYRITAPGSGPG
jgi:RimJ/RimL family protein N-acetyltransferase